MTVKKVFKTANTNNFGSMKTCGEPNASTITVSAKTLSDASKTSAQSTSEKNNKQ